MIYPTPQALLVPVSMPSDSRCEQCGAGVSIVGVDAWWYASRRPVRDLISSIIVCTACAQAIIALLILGGEIPFVPEGFRFPSDENG